MQVLENLGAMVSARHEARDRPDGELRVAVVVENRVIKTGPRMWAIGAVAVSSPQWRAVLNILESALVGIIIYAALNLSSLLFDAIDQLFGGIGDILAARVVRWLMVDGGLWGAAVWIIVALVGSAKLAVVTTWRLLAPVSRRRGDTSEQ